MLSQCFDRILNLTAIIQPAYLFNGFLVTVRIFQVLNQIIRMTASFPAVFVLQEPLREPCNHSSITGTVSNPVIMIPLYLLDFYLANGYNLYHDINFQNITGG